MQGVARTDRSRSACLQPFPASFPRLSGVPYVLDGLQPAPCRSGPGSREVSPEKWNPLRDEGARLCALNPWWETRRHDASTADAAAKIVGVSLRTLVPLTETPSGGATRPELPTAASSGMVPRAQTVDPRHSFGPHAAHRGARQDCDRSAGRGPPNLRSNGRADPEISQEKQEFTDSGSPADLP